MEKTKKSDIYKEVTQRIVMELASGQIPWRKPWNAPFIEDIINYDSRKPYQGINRLLLGEPGEYMTFNQCKKNKGTIKRGTKGHLIVKFGFFIPKERKEEAKRLEAEGKDTSKLEVPYLKKDYVFALDQIEGIETKIKKQECRKSETPTDLADIVMREYCRKNGLKISDSNTDTCEIVDNKIVLPKKEQFISEELWFSTVFSKLVEARLSQTATSKDEKDAAKKNLISEIASSMVINATGLRRTETDEDTKAKCQMWIKVLNKNYRLAVESAGAAEKIAREILQPVFGNQAA